MMKEYIKDGFRFISHHSGYGDTICLNSSEIPKAISVMGKLKIRSIFISQREYNLDSIDFLKTYNLSFIENIIFNKAFSDFSPLAHVPLLKSLTLDYHLTDYSPGVIDFSQLINLERLELEWHKKLHVNLAACKKLKYLKIQRYDQVDLNALSKCLELEDLWMYSPKIKSLNGLKSNRLQTISIDNAAQLADISAISTLNQSLKKLFIYGAPKLQNVIALNSQIQLEMLQLVKLGEIESIGFLNSFKNLHMLGFNGKVKDGDYSPLNRFPASKVPTMKIV